MRTVIFGLDVHDMPTILILLLTLSAVTLLVTAVPAHGLAAILGSLRSEDQ